MSFLGGAECATGANPLAQFTKHVQDDKTLQRDRLVGQDSGGIQGGIRSNGVIGQQDQMMEEFSKPAILQPGLTTPFAMDQMRRELETFQAPPLRTHNISSRWASEYTPQTPSQRITDSSFQASNLYGFSASEFATFQQSSDGFMQRISSPTSKITNGMNAYRYPMGMGMYSGMSNTNMGLVNQPLSNFQGNEQAVGNGKGKSRMVELDIKNWEEQFAQLDAESVKDLETEANAANEREINRLDRSVPSETNEFGDFESIWKGIQAETAAARQMVGEDARNDEYHADPLDEWGNFDGLGTHGASFGDPYLGDYLFEEENMFLVRDVADPFSEGMRVIDEGGNLTLAALAFEAAVQKDPKHGDAWSMLGATQAQNEKESAAIRALEQALKLDPSNLAALMGLAVSYTNEGYDSTAYRTLERWLVTKYPQIVDKSELNSSIDVDVGFTERHILHEKVTDLFIRAAQLSPDGEHMDPDVQVGLGVLFYGAEEFDKAVDCFSAALASTESGTSNQRQQVHLLWNRLGATLANSGRSEEAITAYEKALTINPNFVRARYNLGVSCINIGCYEEAAQHLLGALDMHRWVEQEGREWAREVVGGGVSDRELERIVAQNESTNLYDTLRRVFVQMDRQDLSERVVPGMDVESFRGEFDF
ncbi:MAG: Peroxisomal membrane signal receptor PTS1 [Vezdaea acicularis]|nr:MAG: Peroxisomal membrane signal receptor PTS1 [Vezdaea acicularis]